MSTINIAVANVKKPHELLVDHVLHNTTYGDLLDHQSISVLINCQYGLQEYSRTISKANRSLAHSGKVLKSIRNVGYEVLMPDAYTNYVSDVMAAACRKMQYAKIVAINAPKSSMSMSARLTHVRTARKAQNVSDAVLQQVNELRKDNNQLPVKAFK